LRDRLSEELRGIHGDIVPGETRNSYGNIKAAIIDHNGKVNGHKNMSLKTFEIAYLSENPYDLLSDIQNQTEVLLTREGVPFAKVMPLPVEPMVTPQVGLNYRAMVMSDDFDEPLPDDFWGV
jgi:hypothetical protein